MPFWDHSRLFLLFLGVFLKASVSPSLCRPNIPSFPPQFFSTEMDSLDLQFWLFTYVYHFKLREMRFYCINLKHTFKGARYRIPHLQWAVSTSRVWYAQRFPLHGGFLRATYRKSGWGSNSQLDRLNGRTFLEVLWGQAFFTMWGSTKIWELSLSNHMLKGQGEK